MVYEDYDCRNATEPIERHQSVTLAGQLRSDVLVDCQTQVERFDSTVYRTGEGVSEERRPLKLCPNDGC
jgi:hypothetical protein